jgi:C4-dicarboxylate-specific signal transduction histidine kinase
MRKEAVRRGSAILRPRARIVRTIGRDLIRNEVVALVELIKNAYDADARNVRIVFEEPLQPSQGGILIEDDGAGMSLQVIRHAWFEPATISKTQNTHTPSGRRVTGEKGIGRFAAARVAQAMEVTTLAKGSRRLVRVRFDWGSFDDANAYLDQISCRWEEAPAPHGRKHGTTLHLTGLNEPWDAEQFARLRGELSRLVSPNIAESDFTIAMELPERFKEFAGPITPPPILGKPHYRFAGDVDAQGQLNATYEGPDTRKPVSVTDKILLKGRSPESGPFQFEFRVWDRDSLDPLADELRSTVRQLRQDLDSACGISIYRDDFRVLLADNDWLRLDLRRVQNPTMRLSNNQIVGAVFISADGNKGLRDQTNREGIVSSPAFEDLKDALKEILSKLEVKRDTCRRGQRPQKPAIGLFEALDIAPLREYVAKRYPDDAELKAFLGERTKAFEHGVAEVQQVLARYRRLATLGQIIDVVLHEGRTPVAAISNEAALAKRDIHRTRDMTVDPQTMERRLSTIAGQAEVLSTLFRRLAPFSGRKRGRPAEVAIEDIISDACALFRKRIAELHVKVRQPGGRTMVTVDQAEMQQIFVNLLDNSLYWLEKVPQNRRSIAIEVSPRPGELVILFSDSGPGVPEDVRDRIFDPYFSTKPDGVGLGLTIAGETAAEYDGALELVSGGPLPGATFRVTLRKRIGGNQSA